MTQFGGRAMSGTEYIDNLWCKLYVDADVSREKLVKFVVEIKGGVAIGRTVSIGQSKIYISENDEWKESRHRNPRDGFLYFRYYMDIEALRRQKRAAQIALVADLLHHF